jgi:hypothetical protein
MKARQWAPAAYFLTARPSTGRTHIIMPKYMRGGLIDEEDLYGDYMKKGA